MKKVKQDFNDVFRDSLKEGLDPILVKHLAEELDLALRLQQRRCLLLITLLLVLSVVLVGVVFDKDHSQQPIIKSLAPEEVAYIPQYTLPHDAVWVVTYRHIARNPDLTTTTEQPISKKWVKQVAYHLIVAQQSLALKQDEKATVHFEKALTIFPEIEGVHGSLGTLYLQQKNLEMAIAHLERALDEEESFSVLNNLGVALMTAGELKRAEECLLQAQAMQPEHPASYKNLALLYREAENPESSLAHFKRYLGLYNQDAEAMETYAEYLVELDRREEAAEFLETYSVLHTDHAQQLYLLLAKIEARSTNSVQAVAALQKMSRHISPNLALTKLNQDDFDSIRDTEEFQALIRQVELATVTLQEGWVMEVFDTYRGINIAFPGRFITVARFRRLVGIAQLVRAPDCDSGCRGFESRYSPHFSGFPHPSETDPLLKRNRL